MSFLPGPTLELPDALIAGLRDLLPEKPRHDFNLGPAYRFYANEILPALTDGERWTITRATHYLGVDTGDRLVDRPVAFRRKGYRGTTVWQHTIMLCQPYNHARHGLDQLPRLTTLTYNWNWSQKRMPGEVWRLPPGSAPYYPPMCEAFLVAPPGVIKPN